MKRMQACNKAQLAPRSRRNEENFLVDNSKNRVTNQWFDRESEKPVKPYSDLRKLMTIKTSIFMFKKDHSTNLLLQRRKINTNVQFIKNFSATNRVVENFGTQ